MMDDDLMTRIQAPPAPEPFSKRNRLEKEYELPYNTWKQDPTPVNASALVTAAQPMITSMVKPLGDSPALRNRAKQLVLTAAGQYDPEKASFRTHVMSQLQGLKRIATKQELPINVPERLLLQRRQLNEAHATLEDQLGREPSDTELADYTNLSTSRIAKVRSYVRPVSEGYYDERTNQDGDVSGTPTVESSTPQSILEEYVYTDLQPRDQLIFDYALGRNNRPRLNSRDIAIKLKVTPGAVSQRLSAIQQRFDQLQDIELFGT